MLSVSLVLVLASYAGDQYGVGTKDFIIIMLTPFQTLNAESLPSWFVKKEGQKLQNKKFFSPGFAGNFLLLMWAVLGSLISMAFLSNIRAMLMKPVYQKPIDSTEDIFKVGKKPLIGGGMWPNYLRTSSNEWERLAGETGVASPQGEMSAF